jgi:hypothetical protein
MPLSANGNKIKRKMIEEYGEKEGTRIFYSKENGDKQFSETVRGKKTSKKAEAEWWIARLEKMPVTTMKARVLQRLKLKDPELNWWINRIQAINKSDKKKSQSGAPYTLPVNATGVKSKEKDKKD